MTALRMPKQLLNNSDEAMTQVFKIDTFSLRTISACPEILIVYIF